MLIEIKLGEQRSAWIRKETTIGECEQIAHINKSWTILGKSEHQDIRSACVQALVCVRRWTGLDDMSWPDLEHEFSADSKALSTRFDGLRRYIGVRSLKRINDAVTSAMLPDEKLEGN